MKKFLILLLCVSVIGLSLGLFACSDKEADRTIHLSETTHSVFYAPLYVAYYQGYFDEYNLKIDFSNAGGSDNSMTALLSGGADIALLGPETAVYVKSQNSANNAVIIGQLTQRDGSFLIGRTPMPNFTWNDVRGKEIIGGRQGGMPAMCLEYALTKNGLENGKNITINYDIKFDLITSAFESGQGDFCTMFEPSASQYQENGKGYIVASVGQETGNVAYTCFMVTKDYLSKNKEIATDFMKAVIKGIDYCFTHTSTEIANVIQPAFETTSGKLLVSSVENYQKIDAWKHIPTMTEESFDTLQSILLQSGTITKKIPYDSSVVDNSIVNSILAG